MKAKKVNRYWAAGAAVLLSVVANGASASRVAGFDQGNGHVKMRKSTAYQGKLSDQRRYRQVSALHCRGGASILLDPKGPEGRVQVKGKQVEVKVARHVLDVSGEHSGGAQYDVVISGKKLVSQIQTVVLDDSCSLKGSRLNQSRWNLDSRTTGDVTLEGMFAKSSFIQTGDNLIDVLWVGSEAADVYSESGVMRLAGSVKQTRIRSLGSSQLLLKRLRTEHGWLSASEDAYVEIFGSKRLVVFADGYSQVLSEGVPMLVSESSKAKSMFVIDD